MIVTIPQVLDAQAVSAVLNLLRTAPAAQSWVDGRATSGQQSEPVKNNQQMPEAGAVTAEARKLVLSALSKSPLFMSAALPHRIYPPNFNRYSGEHNAFGNHIDNAMRHVAGSTGYMRTDISCTLFLGEPESYEGGELVIASANQHDAEKNAFKLKAGDLLLYPATTVHRVNPVTQGERIAAFFWVQSMVRSSEQRQTLYELDMALVALRSREIDNLGAESAEAVRLSGVYHNLLRMWCDV